MVDVYLYSVPEDSNPNDVRLRNVGDVTSETITLDKWWSDNKIPQQANRWHRAYYQSSEPDVKITIPLAVVGAGWFVTQALPQKRFFETRDLSVFVPDLSVKYAADFIQHQEIIKQSSPLFRDMSVDVSYLVKKQELPLPLQSFILFDKDLMRSVDIKLRRRREEDEMVMIMAISATKGLLH